MQTYLVGGAVRDMLLSRAISDRDFVVVGQTHETLLAKGFTPVGKDLTIYLHPETRDEYTLAKQYIPLGSGGFEQSFGPSNSLTNDLACRDLTMNAIAWEDAGTQGKPGIFHDPFQGRRDISNKVLRHTSAGFRHDPIRVLRLARFRARLGADWTIAPETLALCQEMAAAGELENLVAERIWKELSRALTEPYPRLFFDTLQEIGCLGKIFPEVAQLRHVAEDERYHPEGNTYEHTMLVLTQMRRLTDDVNALFASLVHDFGKLLTDPALYPRHFNHEVVGVAIIEAFARRLQLPCDVRATAMVLGRYHMHMHRLGELRPNTYLKMLDGIDAFSHPVRTNYLVLLGIADRRGRLGHETDPADDLAVLNRIATAARSLRFMEAVKLLGRSKVPEGLAAKTLMMEARIRVVEQALDAWHSELSPR